VVALVVLAGSASADPASDLGAAESRAATWETEVAAAREELDAARDDYAAVARRADPRDAAARAARTRVRELKAELLDRQREARAEIARLEADREQEEEDQDEEAAVGLGFGLTALIAAAIALAWAWFRSSAPVAALAELRLPQAIGLCLGGGLLLLVVGSVMLGEGLPGVIGGTLVGLGIALPIAFLLARHSLEVERGKAKPIAGRERLPSWVSRVAAALLLLLAVAGILGAFGDDESTTAPVTAQLREQAANPEDGPEGERLAQAETEVAKAVQVAAGPVAQREGARRVVRSTSRQLGQAKGQLVKARAEVRRFTRQLAVLVAREEREAEKQAEQEAEEAEEVEEAAEEELEFEEESSGCDPNYSGCVPVYPPDVDCAEVGESVSSYGTDPHGLDADGDGIGCE
jgi:hypothetical protein